MTITKYTLAIIACTVLLISAFNLRNNTDDLSDMSTLPDYEKEWKEVDKLQEKGLTESALKVVNQIYEKAKKDKNTGQLVKAVVHRLKFAEVKEENAILKNIMQVREEARAAEFPAKPLLHSMMAELYWRYYERNRYRFANRSKGVEVDENDLETWSLDKIVQETFAEYKRSLEEVDRCKAEKVDIYAPLLTSGNEFGRVRRPTLYDFLAQRALDFFMLAEPDLTRPAYYFTINDPAYLAMPEDFSAQEIVTRDTMSTKFHALMLLQDLERFHLKDSDPQALVAVSLQRMNFVKNALNSPGKNDLFYRALEQLEKLVPDHPELGRVRQQRAGILMETATLYVPLQSDSHKWDLKKAYELCEEPQKRFPDSEGAMLCRNQQIGILRKTIGVTVEEHNTPGLPFRALVHYKNFTNLYYRIIKTTRDEVRTQRNKIDKEYRKDYKIDPEQKFIEFYTAKAPVKTGNFTLPDDGDYQDHSLEVKLDELPLGEYMILFSNTAGFNTAENGMAYAFTVITNIGYVHRTLKTGDGEFQVLHRTTGEPMANVAAEAYSFRYNDKSSSYQQYRIGKFTSDENGYFKVPFNSKSDDRNFFVTFAKDGDFNSMESIDKYQGGYESYIYQYETQDPYEQWQTLFFLDRAIYRPGQTIYFKGLVISSKGGINPKIQPFHSTSVTLKDVNNTERGRLLLTTNEYGTFSGTFIAPASGLTGEMHLETDDRTGSSYFSVEEYKRPKFEVVFEPMKGTYRLGDVVKSEGTARAYSGASISDAQVKYRVVREAHFPFWWYCRWGYYPSSPQIEIINGQTITDASGKFKVDFTAIPDEEVDASSDPYFTYTLYADVTDINGETHSTTSYVTVGYKALLVSVYTPNVNKDEGSKEYRIATNNLGGEFEPASGQIKIYSLKGPGKAFRHRLWEEADRKLYTKEQYYQMFPRDVYADENNRFKWSRDKEIFTHNFNTATKKEFVIDNFRSWSPGEYVLEITSKDRYGKEVKEVSYFTAYSPSSTATPMPAVAYFESINAEVEPGNKAKILVGTTESAVKALYEIERDGAIIHREWITLKKEQRLIEIPIKEEYRGNISVHYTVVANNCLYVHNTTISVPYSNKQLLISFESFRDKLKPGDQEEWKIKIAANTADKWIAEMAATLYDESLDEFRANNWYTNFYNYFYAQLQWQSMNGFNAKAFTNYSRNWDVSNPKYTIPVAYDVFNWFGYNLQYLGWYQQSRAMSGGRVNRGGVDAAPMQEMSLGYVANEENVSDKPTEAPKKEDIDSFDDRKKQKASGESDQFGKPGSGSGEVKVRTNFSETAFFYPHLLTNEKGEIIVKFTIPEALTRWKMLGFAHTKDLKYGTITNHLVTQKELMVVPNQPRFFRENDVMTFSTKISSLVDKDLNGEARLEFFDALTMKPIDVQMKNVNATRAFVVKARQSTNVEWNIEIPEGIQAITYRVVARAGSFSDGEEMVLPVATNRMLVTESMPLPIRGKQTREFRLEKMIANQSTTLRHQRYTLEFTSNPAWYAVQALPYMMEYPYECVEQTFSRYYANNIASHIANSNPRIKQVFDTWKNLQPDALLSNLEKNQELKTALLEETPWVLQAKDESQRKRNVALLFDLNRMADEEERALDKVMKAQAFSGGFRWFPGFPEDRYMTQHIVASLGHLNVMGVKSVHENYRIQSMIQSAVGYMDARIKEDYEHLVKLANKKEIKLDDNHIDYINFHYLYARSYFTDITIDNEYKKAFDYFLGQAKKYWLSYDIYLEGMTSLALNRFGDTAAAKEMVKSFSERALHSEELGMYWKTERGYWWYQAPIETQALMIEVYDEVTGDTKSVEDLKVWLLKQKQTQDWKTTRATAEACYALLRRGSDALANTQMVQIKVGDEVIDPTKRADTKVEAGTGYFKTAWQANEITPSMGKVTVTKSDEGVAWGAVYWQYLEQLDKITPAETPLKLKKDLFVQRNTDSGPVITLVNDKLPITIGDLVKVRIELRVDRDMEYVHLKDMRAAGFEPVATLSQQKYQDGLYYYESPRDLATNFFIGYLPKGTYVFEYNLRASQKGNFSNGITTIQCMYAPEFSSHSQGIRVTMK